MEAELQQMQQPEVDGAFLAALLDDDPQDLYENAPCAYLSAGGDGTIVKVNSTFLNWTGYRRDELVGRRRFQDLLAVGDRILFETHVAPMLRLQGVARELAADVVLASGGRLPVLFNVVFRADAARRPSRMRVVLFDATERRSYERELVAARRRAEESEAEARALARTLQASLLPPDLIPVPGFELGAAYRPAGTGSEVMGDFYDVFDTGRNAWGVVLGDVCGKGVEAAVVTAVARYTVRAEAMRSPSPRAVLLALHEVMIRSYPERFCTALYLELTHRGEERAVTLSSGGHHLPWRRRADGSFDRLGRPGTVLGILPETSVHNSRVTLRSGDTLVLFTDGVTEAQRDGQMFEDERLREVIEAANGLGAQELADAVVSAALEFQGGSSRDDMAVVVIRPAAAVAQDEKAGPSR